MTFVSGTANVLRSTTNSGLLYLLIFIFGPVFHAEALAGCVGLKVRAFVSHWSELPCAPNPTRTAAVQYMYYLVKFKDRMYTVIWAGSTVHSNIQLETLRATLINYPSTKQYREFTVWTTIDGRIIGGQQTRVNVKRQF